MTATRLHRLTDEDQPELFQKSCRHLHTIFKTHPCIYGFVLITVVTFDLTELINDWLLFKDISAIEKGLVYGPLNSLIIALLIIICIIGTILFTFEILNLIRDFLSGKPWIDRDLISALIVWLEQIPMVSINIVISFCHDEPISYFQLTKMLLACASVILRLLIPFLRSYINKKKYSGNERFRNYIYKVITTAGLCLLLCGSVSFFIFSHIVGTDKSRFKVRLPQEIWEGHSVKEKYFTDVGIYFHHIKFHDYKQESQQFWIRLTDVMEVYNSKFVFVKLFLQEQNNVIQEIVLKSFDPTHMLSYKCFKLMPSKKQNSFSLYNNISCSSLSVTNDFSEKITFKFVFIHSQVHLILGDISYHAVHLRSNKCRNLWSNETGIFLTEDSEKDMMVGEILYLKSEDDIEDFENEDDLNDLPTRATDMAEIDQFLFGADIFWKTGLFGCQCTGQKGPTMNTSLRILC